MIELCEVEKSGLVSSPASRVCISSFFGHTHTHRSISMQLSNRPGPVVHVLLKYRHSETSRRMSPAVRGHKTRSQSGRLAFEWTEGFSLRLLRTLWPNRSSLLHISDLSASCGSRKFCRPSAGSLNCCASSGVLLSNLAFDVHNEVEIVIYWLSAHSSDQ